MGVFQNIVVKKYLSGLDVKISQAYQIYSGYFLNPQIQNNIRQSKEEQFQEGFLRELFVKVLGYTLNPDPDYNLIPEQKNEKGSKKADAAIRLGGEVVGVIELKDHKTTDLKQVEAQAFGYKNNHRNASYVIISNFEKLRFYIDNAVEFEEFNLFALSEADFARLWLFLSFDSISKGVPKQIKNESVNSEQEITKELYRDYSKFKRELFADLVANNPGYDKLTLFKKSQKLLDRLLFIFFAEDKALLPANSVLKIIDQWRKLTELDEYRPLYERLKKYFGYLNTGHKGKTEDIFAYNGGLFAPDEVLDNVTVSDEVLEGNCIKLCGRNFDSEVDVNILGHIFENSLTEIEEITAEITTGEKPTSKRKKDGVFYTPRYITTYIVENTLGKLCAEKKAELQINEAEYFADVKRQKATKLKLDQKLLDYREWLLSLTICDPACGSGAFLNAALDFLIAEHTLIDEMTAKLYGSVIVFSDVENAILEKNLFGVDINEESIEIAKLSLWLRTAKPHRKLNSLSNNIKCGNSLISDVAVAGDKAFDWPTEFPQVFVNGGFDVVIGNPPYGADIDKFIAAYEALYPETSQGFKDIYKYFFDRGLNLINEDGNLGFITPNTFLRQPRYGDLRRLLLQHRIEQIVDLGEDIFDVVVPTAITIVSKRSAGELQFADLSKQKDAQNLITKLSFTNIEQSLFNQTPNNIFVNNFRAKRENEYLLDEILEMKDAGFKYQRFNVGLSDKGNNDLADRIFSDSSTCDKQDIPILIGRDINSYTYNAIPQKRLRYNYLNLLRDNETTYYNKTIMDSPVKLIWRQTAPYFIGTVLDQPIFFGNTIQAGIIKDDFKETVSYQFLCTLLNSKYLRYLYECNVKEAGRVFPQVKLEKLKPLPIVIPENQLPFIESMDKMQVVNRVLFEKRQKFINRLSDNFEGIKITGALEKFDELEFKGFVAELKKQKIALSLKQQDEWEEYFNAYKAECNALTTKITTTDHQIDQMVYALYNLTPDEIAIIEK